ncbi:uncharacterized protein LOC128040400 [Gossypium raimondii]|uniref:uncharacterized protein LOC128040400 n=1 Tax=Gossypium raimondii TaxID=29730 RepID=UPI00227D5C0A|nr:uncharacterized protein LOC128040400 [Gossypium raimondii]
MCTSIYYEAITVEHDNTYTTNFVLELAININVKFDSMSTGWLPSYHLGSRENDRRSLWSAIEGGPLCFEKKNLKLSQLSLTPPSSALGSSRHRRRRRRPRWLENRKNAIFWLFDSPSLNNIVFHQKRRTSASHGGANARKGTEASCGGTEVDVAVVARDGHTDMRRWRLGQGAVACPPR